MLYHAAHCSPLIEGWLYTYKKECISTELTIEDCISAELYMKAFIDTKLYIEDCISAKFKTMAAEREGGFCMSLVVCICALKA